MIDYALTSSLVCNTHIEAPLPGSRTYLKICKIIIRLLSLHKKMKFSIKDLVTFTEEILNGKLHFLCSVFF